MGFNFGGFMAGVSDAVVDRMQKVEEEKIRIAREDRSIATKQRMAREAERRKKQAVVDEYTGMLKMFGMNEDTIGQVAEYGVGALQTAAGHAETVFKRGGDINTIYRFSPTNDPKSTTTEELVDSVNSTLTALPAEPEALTEGEMKKTAVSDQPIRAAGLTIDVDAMQQFFPMEPEYSSVGAMEAGLINLKFRAEKKGDTAKAAEYDAQLQDLIDYKAELQAAKNADGQSPEFHTASSATSLYNTLQKVANEGLGIVKDSQGRIVSKFKGDEITTPLADYIATSNMLNSAQGDQAVTNLATGINNTATQLLQNAAYGRLNQFQNTEQYKRKRSDKGTGKTITNGVRYFNFGEFDASTLTPSNMPKDMQGNFKQGDVIFIEDNSGVTKLMMYTGVNNPLLDNTPYIIIK